MKDFLKAEIGQKYSYEFSLYPKDAPLDPAFHWGISGNYRVKVSRLIAAAVLCVGSVAVAELSGAISDLLDPKKKAKKK